MCRAHAVYTIYSFFVFAGTTDANYMCVCWTDLCIMWLELRLRQRRTYMRTIFRQQNKKKKNCIFAFFFSLSHLISFAKSKDNKNRMDVNTIMREAECGREADGDIEGDSERDRGIGRERETKERKRHPNDTLPSPSHHTHAHYLDVNLLRNELWRCADKPNGADTRSGTQTARFMAHTITTSYASNYQKRTTNGGRVTSLVVSVLWLGSLFFSSSPSLLFFIFSLHCFRRRFFPYSFDAATWKAKQKNWVKKNFFLSRTSVCLYKAPTANKRIIIYNAQLWMLCITGVR